MADVKPLKLVDQGGGVGRLVEFETGDTLPKSALPALSAADVGAVAADDPRLSDAREWSAETVAQAEAEAGTATTRRAWTAERVRQAIVAWWNSVSSAWGRGLLLLPMQPLAVLRWGLVMQLLVLRSALRALYIAGTVSSAPSPNLPVVPLGLLLSVGVMLTGSM